jgi:iron complex transport system permease protein
MKSNDKISIWLKLKHFYKMHRIIILLYLALICLAIFSITLGRYPIPLKDLFTVFYNKIHGISNDDTKFMSQVIFNIRLPRIIIAILTGSCLSAAGACLQGTFKNPMVSPSLLGVSSGSAFGAALGILFGLNFVGIQSLSFITGILTVVIVYLISTLVSKEGESTTTLILTGMVVSSLFTSLISFLKYVADPYDSLPAITFWLMGSLSNISRTDLLPVLIPALIGLITLILIRFKITIISFGEEEATSLGINYKLVRFIIIGASTLITASVVSICGLIGFVGLIVPHISRLIVGPNYNKLLPASIAIGGIYLLIIDNISRSLMSSEIPLGILTSIIGTPFFIFLLAKKNKS